MLNLMPPSDRSSGTGPAAVPVNMGCSTRVARRHRARGTTLLEIMIAMVVVTVGMLGYFSLHIRSSRMAQSAVRTSQATSVGGAYQDSLLAVPFNPTTQGDGTTGAYFTSCTVVPADRLADLCSPQQVNVLGTTNVNDGPLVFRRSWSSRIINGPAQPMVEYRVRVRYAAEDGRCPDCLTNKVGYKAVTLTSIRSMTGN